MKHITLIGNGNMALSIAKGLPKDSIIEVVGRNEEKLKAFVALLDQEAFYTPLEHFHLDEKIVLLCVKPNSLEDVASKLTGSAKTLYSILAGTSIEKLKQHIKASHYVRAMPNLAASLGASMTTLTGDEACKEEAKEIFSSIGKTLWLPSQKELDIATALAGSGPAYLALVAEALADGAVKEGLKRDDAIEITQGLFEGFAKLLDTSHTALLKDGVMSPGGTTAAGYAALEKNGVRSAFIEAIEAAYKRAQKLS